MSTFDIAGGITQSGLNTMVAGLYAVPAARNGLFKGSMSQQEPVIGNAVVTYDITQVPTFVLQPPTTAQWLAAVKVDAKTPQPTADALQLVFPMIVGSLTVGTSPPTPASGPMTVFAVLSVTGGVASLDPVAVALDESSFSVWDKIIVNGILVPALLKMAAKVLVFALPTIPTFLDLKFQPLTAMIESNAVVAGASLVGGGTTDLTNLMMPGFDNFAMCGLNLVNTALNNEVNGQTFEEKGQSGPSGWYAAGDIKASNVLIVVSTQANQIIAAVGGSFSGYGELGGVGVGITKAVLCPIGAAVDAIANPSDWDKVIASFDLLYKPSPLPVPITIAAGAVDDKGNTPVNLSIDPLPTVQLIYKPTWSGSVTGTVLSAAAAAFIDLVSVLFGKLIINEILKKHGQDHTVYTVPPLAQSVDGVTATLTIAAKPITVIGPVFAQPFQITFS